MKSTHDQNKVVVRIESDNGKDVFEDYQTNIILIQSASNYIEIYYREGTFVRKKMIRQTLNNVELQLSKFSDFKKSHRCCLVNIKQLSRLAGTSPNFTLEAKGLDIQIPISRHNVTKFRKFLSDTK